MPPSKPEEVKNFDFESRIREIISESFEPVLRREAEDRENIISLLRRTEKHRKQLSDLEIYNRSADKRMLQIDDLNKRLFSNESERRIAEADFTKRLDEYEDRFSNLNMEVERKIKLLKQIEDRNAFLDKELNAIHTVITDHKDAIAKTVRDLLTRIEYNCSDLVRASAKAEASAKEASQRLAEMLKLGPQLSSQVETMKKIVGDCEYEVTRMKRSKLEEKDLIPHRKEWQLEVGKLKDSMHQEDLRRNSVEQYLDKYVPLTVQAILSESLHASLDNKALRRFSQFESAKIPMLKNTLTENTTNSLDELRNITKEAVNKAEIRAAQPEYREETPPKPKSRRRRVSISESSEDIDETSRTKKRSRRRRKQSNHRSHKASHLHHRSPHHMSGDQDVSGSYTESSQYSDESDFDSQEYTEIMPDLSLQPENAEPEGTFTGAVDEEQETGQIESPQGHTGKSSPSVKSRQSASRNSSRSPMIATLEFNFDQLSEATPKSTNKTQKIYDDAPEGEVAEQDAYSEVEHQVPIQDHSESLAQPQEELDKSQNQAGLDDAVEPSAVSSLAKESELQDSTQRLQVSYPISEMSEDALTSEIQSPDIERKMSKMGLRSMRRLRKNLTMKDSRDYLAIAEPQFSEEEVKLIRGIPTEFSVFKAELMNVFEQRQNRLLDMQDKGFEELKTYVEMIQTELETATRMHKRDRAEWKSRVVHFETILSQAGDEMARRSQEVRHMSQMIACLAEFDLISNSLMQQDELDREGIQLTGYREVSKSPEPKQIVTMSTDCVSCSGQSAGLLAAFKMACLSYSPSQLTYRHRIFTRHQLLNVQAAMLQGCWSELKQHSPFIGADFAPNFDDPISVKTTKKKSSLMEPHKPGLQDASLTPKTKPRHVRLDALNSTL